MLLKEGKMNLREFSEWLGYKNPDGFAKASESAKKKKLAMLNACADYHFDGKSIYIDKVYVQEYSSAYQRIEQEFPKEWGQHLKNPAERRDTCARVGGIIWCKNPDIQAQIKPQTAKSYVNKIKVEQYGHNYLDDHGTKGYSKSVWVTPANELLDADSLAILNECRDIAYQSLTEFVADIDGEYYAGTISKAERDRLIGEKDTGANYDRFMELVGERLGYFPLKQTQLIDDVTGIEFE